MTADPPDADWPVDEIELAYQRALNALDASSEDIAAAVVEEPVAAPGAAHDLPVPAEHAPEPAATGVIETTLASNDAALVSQTPVAPGPPRPVARPASRQPARPAHSPSESSAETEVRISPAQVIEAALFVGGPPLSAGKLYALLRGTVSVEQVPAIVDELNSLYAAQSRPYEIRPGDGGYRLELRREYDRLKLRVFGQGPREVRLTQDVLEVLALVAYRQPISEAEIETHGKPGAGNVLRQLLRRDLIQIERGENGPKDVRYRTTERFLSVFGIGSLTELPQPEDLAVR